MFQIIDLSDGEVIASTESKERLVSELERFSQTYAMFTLDLGVRDTCAGTTIEARSLLP